MTENFAAVDGSERHLGIGIDNMTPAQLVSYLKDAMTTRHGIELRIDGNGAKERAVMTQLQKVYGTHGSGLILKYAVSVLEGLDEKGKPITFFAFQKARKWWTDELFGSAQQELRRARVLLHSDEEATAGFGTLSSFLGKS